MGASELVEPGERLRSGAFTDVVDIGIAGDPSCSWWPKRWRRSEAFP
jgi:hypothetical protein